MRPSAVSRSVFTSSSGTRRVNPCWMSAKCSSAGNRCTGTSVIRKCHLPLRLSKRLFLRFPSRRLISIKRRIRAGLSALPRFLRIQRLGVVSIVKQIVILNLGRGGELKLRNRGDVLKLGGEEVRPSGSKLSLLV